MAGIDPYEWFAGVHEFLKPTLQEIYDAQQEAERLHCGYSMKRGRPGTFRANMWVDYGQLLVLDLDELEEAWKNSSTSLYRFVDGELSIENMWDSTRVEMSYSSVGDLWRQQKI
jgi:hypothetical protein